VLLVSRAEITRHWGICLATWYEPRQLVAVEDVDPDKVGFAVLDPCETLRLMRLQARDSVTTALQILKCLGLP
jgi:hypothetical protein